MFYKIGVLKKFAKFKAKHLRRSLFLIKLQVSMLQHCSKKRLRHKCFLMNSVRYLRRLFCRTPPGDYFCSTEKYSANKIVKSPLKKRKKKDTAGKKNSSPIFSASRSSRLEKVKKKCS